MSVGILCIILTLVYVVLNRVHCSLSIQWVLSVALVLSLSLSSFLLTLPILHGLLCVLCLVAQLCLTLCDPMDHSPPSSPVHGDSPGKNTRVGYHTLLQGIFPTQGLNPGFVHWRQILYHLSHQGKPIHVLLSFNPFD